MEMHLLRLVGIDPESAICVGDRAIRKYDAEQDCSALALGARAQNWFLAFHDGSLPSWRSRIPGGNSLFLDSEGGVGIVTGCL